MHISFETVRFLYAEMYQNSCTSKCFSAPQLHGLFLREVLLKRLSPALHYFCLQRSTVVGCEVSRQNSFLTVSSLKSNRILSDWNAHTPCGRFVKQKQWERWRAKQKLVSGSNHRVRSGGGRPPPPLRQFETVYAKSWNLGHFCRKWFAMPP